MVFSSLIFMYIFMPLFLAAYFIVPGRWRNLCLLLFSLIFYAWGEPVYILVMLFSTAVDYTLGLQVQKRLPDKRRAKKFVVLFVAVNLSLLGFFKYYDFFAAQLDLPALGLTLPIGISFYTFQSMSYTIDVYRSDGEAQRDFVDFAAYVTMFPQLVAGPIVKYKDVAHQLSGRTTSLDDFGDGTRLFICGLAKKALLANNIGLLWEQVGALDAGDMSVALYWLGIVAFAFQIYFDFSGYSDMAVGLGRMLGFSLPRNFNYPYVSRSITEFWRRWHMSLSAWFRDYVYIPLGGSRRGNGRTYLNLLIVWALTGFWHGAAWSFLCWGLYFAALLIVEKAFLLRVLDRCPRFVAHIYALLAILVGWALFAFEDMAAAGAYISGMFGFGGAPVWNGLTGYLALSFAPMLIVMAVASTPLGSVLYARLAHKRYAQVIAVAAGAALLFVSTAYLVDSTYNPFLYFRF